MTDTGAGSRLEGLLAQAKAGDKAAEEELFGFLRARFVTIVQLAIGEEQVADDLAHEACLTVMKKYRSENVGTGFKFWATKILRNKIGDYLRSKRVRERGREYLPRIEETPGDLNPTQTRQLERALIDCLRMIARTNTRYARILLFSYHGYDTEYICSRLAITRTNLYSLLSRSRSTLSHCLETGEV
jgi:RNA polymerase sigma factor (sigma-70 family)